MAISNRDGQAFYVHWATFYFLPSGCIGFDMSDDDYPSRSLDRIMVRLPDGMRDQLGEAAKANKRSTNAEVVARLENSFATPFVLPASLREKLSEEAQENGRSLHSEIIHRLTSTVAVDKDYDKDLLPFLADPNALVELARERFTEVFRVSLEAASKRLEQVLIEEPELLLNSVAKGRKAPKDRKK